MTTPLRPLADALYANTEPSPLQAQAIAEVRAMATELAALPSISRAAYLAEIRKQTSGRQRHLATRFTPPDHPAFRALMAMLDALIAEQGTVPTKHGAFTPDDLKEAEAKLTRLELAFPVRYPWQRKPNPETGEPGIRTPAVFRTIKERAQGAKVGPFRAVPCHEGDDKEWFDE